MTRGDLWSSTVAPHECHALNRSVTNRSDKPVVEFDLGVEPPDLAESLEAIVCEHRMALALERTIALPLPRAVEKAVR